MEGLLMTVHPAPTNQTRGNEKDKQEIKCLPRSKITNKLSSEEKGAEQNQNRIHICVMFRSYQ
jgi:hypothetical protein